ncbi:MAG: high frequency lysogenization protein HflD [Gammaproteobacteria bacterium]|nr:high frequency lysogenization protein HflD [Gammaproteobacteria bacterium]MDH5594832.1 high frequency lysogenization protein HflD [Gammaproteobacteria bacterium]
MIDINPNKVFALAGIFQAAGLVQEVACKNTVDQQAFNTSIHSIFKINADSVEDIYGDISGLKYGLEMIARLFDKKNKQTDMEITRYVISIMVLERKLIKNTTMLEQISAGIQKAEAQSEHFHSHTHENVIANLADLYLSTISTLTPRIMVSGAHGYLEIPDNANKVRTLLLAGIRSAVLWRQKGGGRLQLIFGRNKILKTTENILSSLPVLH